MKTKFQDIVIGAEFEAAAAANGKEARFYKISEGEAYQISGSGSGLRISIDSDAVVTLTGKRYAIHTTPNDIERTAVTLMGPGASHTGLALWVNSIAANPDELRHLDDFVLNFRFEAEESAVSLAEFIHKQGYVTPESREDREHSTAAAIRDLQARGQIPDNPGDLLKAKIDAAVLRLAAAVIDHRLAGRPDSPVSASLWERGAGVLKSTIPLATAIVDYHQALVAANIGRLKKD